MWIYCLDICFCGFLSLDQWLPNFHKTHSQSSSRKYTIGIHSMNIHYFLKKTIITESHFRRFFVFFVLLFLKPQVVPNPTLRTNAELLLLSTYAVLFDIACL